MQIIATTEISNPVRFDLKLERWTEISKLLERAEKSCPANPPPPQAMTGASVHSNIRITEWTFGQQRASLKTIWIPAVAAAAAADEFAGPRQEWKRRRTALNLPLDALPPPPQLSAERHLPP